MDDLNAGFHSKLLSKLPRPCAVFAVDDLRAALLCRIALAAGYRIPQDFLLLGVDDNLVICDSTPLPLSSIALDSRGIGYRAAELLAAMLEGQGSTTAASAAAATPAAVAASATCAPGDPLLIELPPLKVVERASTESGTRRDPLVARALFFIDREFNQGLTIEALAQRIGVSPRYLQMRFKSALACTPQQALLERRIKEAKALLQQSDLSITAVAYASGFGDYKQMAHHLRRDCGKTARDYRQDFRV